MKNNHGFRGIAFLLVALFIVSWIIAAIIGSFIEEDVYSGNVAIIPIEGYISFSAPLGFTEVVNPHTTTELIEKAAAAPNVKAIVFDINSGGGTPVASETIINSIKAANKTTVAIIRDVGASGAYWIASATDHIIASKYSITGSIGVRGSFIDYYGLMQKYNISYERFVGGEFKDMGDPFKPVTDAERQLYQQRIDKMHDMFVDDIQLNRNLGASQKAEISSGSIYLGQEAKHLGLVDIVGGEPELKQLLEQELNTTDLVGVRLERKLGLLDRIPALFSNNKLQVNSGISFS